MFQTKLRELREAAGYKSQQAFADAFGVAQSTVGGWESGKREPNYETIVRLSAFLGVPVGYLLTTERQDGYSARFRNNLAQILRNMDGFTSDDGGAMYDYHQLESLTETAYPLSLAEACDAAEKIGESVSYLLQDNIGSSCSLKTEKTPALVSEDGRVKEFIALFSQLTEEQQKMIVAQIKGILAEK